MKLKSWGLLAIIAFFAGQSFDIQAQKIEKNYEIEWLPNMIFSPDENTRIELLYFKGAASDNNGLPLFIDLIPVDNYFQQYDISISNVNSVPLQKSEQDLLPEDFNPKEFKVEIKTLVERKKNFASVNFIPVYRNESGNWMKVTSVDISFTGRSPKLSRSRTSYAQNSILRTGEWYKIAVNQSGLYKVTYEDFVKLGIPVNGLQSSQISVFGNGGGMLPEKNGVPRADDLRENPILVYDNGDGTFDEGDYFVFYAQGPHSWIYNPNNKQFNHQLNVYSNYAYYFISVNPGIGEKQRINDRERDYRNLVATHTANTYTYYGFLEKDERILGKWETGRKWFSDIFDMTTVRTYTMDVPAITSERARVSVSAAFSSAASSRITVSVNNQIVGYLRDTGLGSDYIANMQREDYNFNPTSSKLEIKLDYNKPIMSSKAYLDWIEVQAVCDLRMHSAQFLISHLDGVGEGEVTLFNIGNSDTRVKVWDVTDPVQPYPLAGNLDGNVFSFKAPTDTLRKFVVFNGSSFKPVTTVGKIANQDLHANSEVDMIIVSHRDFLSEAERLADYRRQNSGLTVRVVTPEQIYNEFSSGAQDPTAIRDYMKMISEKSNAVYPKYLLLFGRASYDYRAVNENGPKVFVPNFQVDTHIREGNYRANDDYFGILGDGSGEGGNGLLDVAVGRFPVTTLAQAKTAVDKTIRYSAKHNLVTDANSGKISNLADWRNVITFVADDENGIHHISTADQSAEKVALNNKSINIEKIYLDAYQRISHAGGSRYPEVNIAINNRMERGTLVMAYTGHGGGNGWAQERVLEISDINAWANTYNQTIMVTLTCEFTWYDGTAISPGEMVFHNPRGGAAGLITTSRISYTNSATNYLPKLFEIMFERDANNQYRTLGELNRVTKNLSGGAIDHFNMIIVLGDPSMELAIPRYSVITDSINGKAVQNISDTITALSRVTVKGHIADQYGNPLTGFNGNIYPSVFDKPVTMRTLQNSPESGLFEFEVQKNVLFKGNASVNNGYFEFGFITPKDINYTYGNGKISYYAKSEDSDASGYFDQILIGGISNDAIADSLGPEIKIYLNDENFVNGGITDPNPTLLVHLKDDYGINMTGNGIGHDLSAILDNASESPIILNDYFEAKEDAYGSGVVHYPLKDLAVGKHTIKIRAWDIANNVSENILNFEVVSDEKLTLDHVLNYPNPFTTHTDFFFEHNQPGERFDILVQIFTISGKLVATLSSTQVITGNRCEGISWNGRDEYGDKIGKGVYLYRVKVRNQQGEIAEKIEKLVIL